MTDLDLAAIRERVEKATPGPWREDGPWWHDNDEATVVITVDVDRAAVCIQPPLHARRGLASDADMEFIAHAREDIPALLAEIDRLNATIQRVRDIVNDKYLDAGQMDVMLRRALEGGEGR